MAETPRAAAARPASRVRVPLRERWRDLRRGALPAVVWLAAAWAAFSLLQRQRRAEFPGLVRGGEYEVSAATDGVLRELLVDLYEPVAAGDVVAFLDDRVLAARIETARAQVDQLQEQLRATAARLAAAAAQAGRDWSADLRRFLVNEADFLLEEQRVRVDLEADRAEAERLEIQLARTRNLVAEAVLSQAELDDVRLFLEGVRRRVAENERLLARLQEERAAATERRESYAALAPPSQELDPELEAVRASVRVQASLLRELEVQRAALTLRAAADGRVTQVLARPGQAVLAGEPLVLLASARADGVVVYLPEGAAAALAERSRVQVALGGGAAGAVEAVVERVSPGIEMLPARLWVNPNVPEYGRAALVRPAPGLEVLPGQRVVVWLAD